ncbi:CBS domain-containing protein [Methylonatrum kenyense]|uniref:CBS domain-containing protein n=1 Tax=Methylonatrum kenyense TaxID=455253 RepID=UPI0020C03BDC|nr:CBS domain-containing protein [Methylonatrum kenyense]MCK8515032.1 CBS domain-containing protein [Methylonatrum kenyense]
MSSLLVRDVMARHPFAITLGTGLDDVVESLVGHHLTGLPVIDTAGHVVGFVSEQDCLKALLVSNYHAEGAPKVEDVMRRDLVTAQPGDAVVDIAEHMLHQKPKVYPVLDDTGRLVGTLSRTQVLRAMMKNHQLAD